MSTLEGWPLPPTAEHDEFGRHIPPHIPEWRFAAENDPNRVVRGSEVERDQKAKEQFAAHLEEHRRRGEPDTVIGES